jgi:hypothetical protein
MAREITRSGKDTPEFIRNSREGAVAFLHLKEKQSRSETNEQKKFDSAASTTGVSADARSGMSVALTRIRKTGA